MADDDFLARLMAIVGKPVPSHAPVPLERRPLPVGDEFYEQPPSALSKATGIGPVTPETNAISRMNQQAEELAMSFSPSAMAGVIRNVTKLPGHLFQRFDRGLLKSGEVFIGDLLNEAAGDIARGNLRNAAANLRRARVLEDGGAGLSAAPGLGRSTREVLEELEAEIKAFQSGVKKIPAIKVPRAGTQKADDEVWDAYRHLTRNAPHRPLQAAWPEAAPHRMMYRDAIEHAGSDVAEAKFAGDAAEEREVRELLQEALRYFGGPEGVRREIARGWRRPDVVEIHPMLRNADTIPIGSENVIKLLGKKGQR